MMVYIRLLGVNDDVYQTIQRVNDGIYQIIGCE